ncbi:hypothetical protein T492DRAFT_1083283 [Pavlovales sp. CCMP2436]|nr:hypothetical protein T492DRAFT_1083283 [Pavlovales sp. CCMP2436]|mmetsp:Transcript_47749/g.109892  ORF Transcript_47749/g.109892 Transcript_47749/m.109892 type:complete len:274 (+) Transcript_47749:136-957(+)|eukprot:CAMPEP_0179852616 /NCGR_PEP_ID=MMETSP0982-20121206/8899_1 /TAXON_ID=483367 /ORGANISM="non described non described, Strain CCMP 2436" /LENGTH=273 /DNA_ID=CAMNT_0021738255 /DNA_START=199 /DNA_END=1020 /DNA_ORIENTATION=+
MREISRMFCGNLVMARLHVLLLSAALMLPSADAIAVRPALLSQGHSRVLSQRFVKRRAATTALMPLPGLSLAELDSNSAGSYYVTLGLFVLTFPGIFSQVTRATKAKIKRKTYELPGPLVTGSKPIKQVAGEVVGHFQANNYKIQTAGETIVFEGRKIGTRGQSAFLTFCVFMSLGSLSLVLSIFEKQAFGETGGLQLGNYWFLSTLVSPLAGKYYLDNSERTDLVSVKLVISDDEKTIDLTVEGDEPELERIEENMKLMQKGMEYVPGLLER